MKIECEDLINLHGFEKIDKNNPNTTFKSYIPEIIKKFEQDNKVYHNWAIRRDWKTTFLIDMMILNGYHLTGVSSIDSSDREACKCRGFEIFHELKQIGSTEAKSVLITGLS